MVELSGPQQCLIQAGGKEPPEIACNSW